MSKIVLITGASRGIGAATALLAAGEGYAVAVNYVADKASARKVVDTIESGGGTAVAIQADISTEAGVLKLFRETDEQLGTLNALVNNAGILDTQSTLEDMTEARLNRVFTTNITGSFLCAREAVKRMSSKNGGPGGAIVNVSSGAARVGSPNEYVDYAASRAPSTP